MTETPAPADATLEFQPAIRKHQRFNEIPIPTSVEGLPDYSTILADEQYYVFNPGHSKDVYDAGLIGDSEIVFALDSDIQAPVALGRTRVRDLAGRLATASRQSAEVGIFNILQDVIQGYDVSGVMQILQIAQKKPGSKAMVDFATGAIEMKYRLLYAAREVVKQSGILQKEPRSEHIPKLLTIFESSFANEDAKKLSPFMQGRELEPLDLGIYTPPEEEQISRAA